MMIYEIDSIGSEVEKYESLMVRMPGFSLRGEALKAYLLKMLEFGRILIECDNGMILGLIGFYANDMKSKVAYVSSFVISQNVEGKGLARQLFEMFLKIAKSAGMETMELNVWKDNPRAIAFYSKMGLRVVGCGRDANHWLMRGNLGNIP